MPSFLTYILLVTGITLLCEAYPTLAPQRCPATVPECQCTMTFGRRTITCQNYRNSRMPLFLASTTQFYKVYIYNIVIVYIYIYIYKLYIMFIYTDTCMKVNTHICVYVYVNIYSLISYVCVLVCLYFGYIHIYSIAL